MSDKKYIARIHRSGSMIQEMLALINYYNPQFSKKQWIDDVVRQNLIGKKSRSWTQEIIVNHFYPRFVNCFYQHAWKDIKLFMSFDNDMSVLKPLLYYFTAKSDDFLYDFIVNEVFRRYYNGQLVISAMDVYEYINSLPESKFNKIWDESVKRKAGRSVMAILRDFGILEGKKTKTISAPFVPIKVFVYIAFLLYKNGITAERLLKHADWKLFLLSEKTVERMFLEAHQHGFLSYQAAGKIVRIEFHYETTEELINALNR
ncbi:BrxA family protein [Calditrichota bacterium GD2]